MSMGKVKELLKAVKTDPKAQEALQGLTRPQDEEGIIRYYTEAVKKLGFDVTEVEIRETVANLARERQDETETAVSRIEALPDDALEQATGGAGNLHSNDICEDTYEHRENCWANDGCDTNSNIYPKYECEHNYKGYTCGSKDSFDCSQFMF